METIGDAVIGGAIANFVFAALFAVGAFVKSRLNSSHCHMDCGCLKCDSDLKELDDKLTRTQSTQRVLLEQIMKHLADSDSAITRETPSLKDSPRILEDIAINLPRMLKLPPGAQI